MVLINNAASRFTDDLNAIGAALERASPSTFRHVRRDRRPSCRWLTDSRGAIVNNVSTMAWLPCRLTRVYAILKAGRFQPDKTT